MIIYGWDEGLVLNPKHIIFIDRIHKKTKEPNKDGKGGGVFYRFDVAMTTKTWNFITRTYKEGDEDLKDEYQMIVNLRHRIVSQLDYYLKYGQGR
jgi:hypothetical protein